MFTPFHRGGAGEPLVLLHGFTDTWRTWELVLPALERRHDVLAPALPGHAGGPPLPEPLTTAAVLDLLESQLDAAGFETAHLAGNSLGGYLALALAARGRARSVVALAPAGGWLPDDHSYVDALERFRTVSGPLRHAAPYAERIAASEGGRRQTTREIAVRFEHIPPDLVAHMIRGAAACAVEPQVELALRERWPLDAEQVTCPVRIVWGTVDELLPWPSAAEGYRRRFPHADWVELDDVGHAVQLDVPTEAAALIA